MLKRLLLAIFSVSVLLPLAGAAFEEASCFDYYKYGANDVFLHFAPERSSYSAGDTIRIPFTIKNDFGIPVVDGNVKIVIVYKGPEDANNVMGDEIVDEFFVEDAVNLQPGGIFEGRAVWVSQKDLPSGVYAANGYLTQNGKFNLKGLSFTTSTPGATSTFRLDSVSQKHANWDKGTLKVNGNAYSDRDFVPFIQPGEKITINAGLKGTPEKITGELFSWDTNKAGNRISETMLSGNPVTYPVGTLEEGVYLARLTAYSGDSRSVQWVRLAVEGIEGRIVHMGLGKFPGGEDTRLHICVQNSPTPSPGGKAFTGSGKVTVKDSTGKVIAQDSFENTEITAYPLGLVTTVDLPSSTKLSVSAELLDSSGKLQDSAELVYDLSAFAGIERNIGINSPPSIAPGENIELSVGYTDGDGNPLSGKLFLTVEDSDGVVLLLSEIMANEGSKKLDTASFPQGSYTLKAVDGENGASQSARFTIGDAGQTLNKPAGPAADPSLLILAGIAAAAVILVILLRKRK